MTRTDPSFAQYRRRVEETAISVSRRYSVETELTMVKSASTYQELRLALRALLKNAEVQGDARREFSHLQHILKTRAGLT